MYVYKLGSVNNNNNSNDAAVAAADDDDGDVVMMVRRKRYFCLPGKRRVVKVGSLTVNKNETLAEVHTLAFEYSCKFM